MNRPAASTGRLEPVDWALAERVGVRIAGRLARPDAHLSPSAAQMDDLVARAEALVGAHTGLVPDTPARAQVLSREDWVRANIGSVRRLLTPLWERWTEEHPSTGSAAGSSSTATSSTGTSSIGTSLMVTVAPKVSAAQIGSLLGWMSGRVLGQYDVLVAAPENPPPDTDRDTSHGTTGRSPVSGDDVYLVGPNLVALEQRYAFAPDQFRLWVALHEVTHRAQFRGVPWMLDHYRGLVDQMLTIADPDPTRLWEALRSAVTDRESSRAALRDGGAVAVLAGPEQRATLDRISGLMSLLEGHGDVTMDRAGAGQLPDALRFAHVLRMRRATAAPLTRLVQRLIGLEAKLDQYRAGEAFIETVEAAAGPSVIERCWQSPANLPTLAEIRRPDTWLARTATHPTNPLLAQVDGAERNPAVPEGVIPDDPAG
jgi:coenzyme F420 biosynthesis associated uncharacterized protein